MPRYYIQVEPQGFKDNEGEELSGPEAAKGFAAAIAADLMRNREEAFPYQRLLVTDEVGAVIHEAALMLH